MSEIARKVQYQSAPRAIPVTDFPTPGFYYIWDISVKSDKKGDIFPVADVHWKLSEDDKWETNDSDSWFHLRLDYLVTRVSVGPNISLQELKGKIIKVFKSFCTSDIHGYTPGAIWELMPSMEMSSCDKAPVITVTDVYGVKHIMNLDRLLEAEAADTDEARNLREQIYLTEDRLLAEDFESDSEYDYVDEE